MFDQTIPHMGVLMIKDDPKVYPRYSLPEGYRFEAYRRGREKDWARIQQMSGQGGSLESWLEAFEQSYGGAKEALADRMLFVLSPEGQAVATISVWPGGAFGEKRPRLHWVAVEEAYQGKGLSNAMMTGILDAYQRLEDERPLYVATQTWSYLAARVYERFGFVPYMGPKPEGWKGEENFEAHAQEAWALIRKMQKALEK